MADLRGRYPTPRATRPVHELDILGKTIVRLLNLHPLSSSEPHLNLCKLFYFIILRHLIFSISFVGGSVPPLGQGVPECFTDVTVAAASQGSKVHLQLRQWRSAGQARCPPPPPFPGAQTRQPVLEAWGRYHKISGRDSISPPFQATTKARLPGTQSPVANSPSPLIPLIC